MNPTRACTLADLGLMRLEDALKWIAGKHEWKDIGIDILGLLRSKNFTIHIPAKSYAVSVVDRFANEILFDGELCDIYNSVIYLKSDLSICFWNFETKTYFGAFRCPTNPFEGLTNADGTPVTSVTRETLEQWRREERG